MGSLNRKHHEFDLLVSKNHIGDHRVINIFGYAATHEIGVFAEGVLIKDNGNPRTS